MEAFKKHTVDTGNFFEKLQREDVPVARDLCYGNPVGKVKPSFCFLCSELLTSASLLYQSVWITHPNPNLTWACDPVRGLIR